MKGLAMMKVDKGKPAGTDPQDSPMSAKTTALQQAAKSLKQALAAVQACLDDGNDNEDDADGDE